MAHPPRGATLVSRDDVTPTLAVFRLLPDDGVPAFQAGQFVTLGLPCGRDGEVHWRAYSVASPPSETRWLELYVRLALAPAPGHFTTALWALAPGARLQHRGVAGAFTIEATRPDGTPETRALLCIAGGTGLAPFVSYALEMRARAVPRALTIVHGASHVEELGYRDVLEQVARDTRGAGEDRFRLRYVPTLSRPGDPRNAGWSGETGRAESLLAPDSTGACRLDAILGRRIVPEDFVAHACGWSGTIQGTLEALEARGFVRHRARRADGSFDLKVESYG